jgi:hypothetical protein
MLSSALLSMIEMETTSVMIPINSSAARTVMTSPPGLAMVVLRDGQAGLIRRAAGTAAGQAARRPWAGAARPRRVGVTRW